MQSINQQMTGNVMMSLCRIGLPESWMNLLFLALVLSFFSDRVHAYHFPWDQGHDVTQNTDNDDQPGPCEGEQCDPCNSTGSPIYLPTGHFIWSDTDVMLAGRMNLSLRRTYNSHDPRDGMFGNGWSSSCEPSLYKTLLEDIDEQGKAYSRVLYQLLLPNGKRYTYQEQGDGTVQAPSNRYDTLEPMADGTTKLTAPSGAYRVFAASGEILSSVDRNGNVINYNYDESGRLTRQEGRNGRYLEFTYNASGRVSEVKDHTQRRWLYDYDSNGNLVAVTDPMNGSQTYEYQPFTNIGDNQIYYQLTRVVDPSGVTLTAVTYDGVRAISYTEGENRYNYSYRLDSSTQPVTKTDSTGTTWRFVQNIDDQIITEESILSSSGSWITTRYEYDEYGNKIKVKDPRGWEWSKEYDIRGRLISSTDAGFDKTTYTYDGDKPWPVSMTTPDDKKTYFSYNDRGDLITITDPAQKDTTLSWSDQGDLLQATDPLGRTMTMTYNDDGLLTSVTNGEGHSRTYQYDELGRRIKETLPNGDSQRWEYDANNRMVTQINGLGDQLHFQYDPAGRLIQLIDSKGNINSFDYDDYGRLIAERRPDSEDIIYTYREDGLVENKITPNQEKISYEYDIQKQLIVKSLPSVQYNFDYNKRGELTSVTGTNGTSSSFVYSSVGLIRSETQQSRTIDVSYLDDREVNRLTVDGESHRFSRNSAGQITHFYMNGAYYEFKYDDAGQITSMTYPGGESEYKYNQVGQVVEEKIGNSVSTIFSYEYDLNGRLTQRQDESADWRYGYDAVNQLVSAESGAANYFYEFDKSGNRIEKGQQYDPFNKMLASFDSAYINDKNGNRLKKIDIESGEVFDYKYDALNRLIRIVRRPGEGESPTLTAAYKYDAFNRRVEKQVLYHKEGRIETTEFLWMGNKLVAEYENGETVARKRYRYAHGFAPVSYTDSGENFTVHSDNIDAPKIITDSQGVVAWEAAYLPYGVSSANENDDAEIIFNIRFPGQYYDRESGLYYNLNRTYDPEEGRYLQSDPLGFYDGTNTYTYVHNNPTMEIDPTGEFAWGLAFAGADLALQLYQNGGNFSCVNWTNVGLSMLGGGLLNGLTRGAFKFKTIGSHSWDATRKWMTRNDIMPNRTGIQRHHWLFERNQGIGKNVPGYIKNQPWNINPVSSSFNNWMGRNPWRAPLGAPSWAVESLGGAGVSAGSAVSGDDCGCD